MILQGAAAEMVTDVIHDAVADQSARETTSEGHPGVQGSVRARNARRNDRHFLKIGRPAPVSVITIKIAKYDPGDSRKSAIMGKTERGVKPIILP